jgi:hypothetical protein
MYEYQVEAKMQTKEEEEEDKKRVSSKVDNLLRES